MNENLFIMFSHWLKFHHQINTRYGRVYAAASRKKDILMGFWGITCCKFALTLSRQIWRQNYVISRNEYL